MSDIARIATTRSPKLKATPTKGARPKSAVSPAAEKLSGAARKAVSAAPKKTATVKAVAPSAVVKDTVKAKPSPPSPPTRPKPNGTPPMNEPVVTVETSAQVRAGIAARVDMTRPSTRVSDTAAAEAARAARKEEAAAAAAAAPPLADDDPGKLVETPEQPQVQFKVGDKAVYPRGGVAEVIGIEDLDIGGNRQSFYVLRLLQNNSKIRVPVGNANAVGLRQLISEQEIQEVFDILRERTIAFDKQTWNRRYRGFMDKIKTGSIYDVAEVLRDLYRLKTDKQLSFGEKRMLDEARTLIVKEIAIARGQTEEDVKNEIEAIFLAN